MNGLPALLDDVAAIAKVAAASVDDVVGQAVQANSKAAGAVIDDAAVTPKYVHGFSADRAGLAAANIDHPEEQRTGPVASCGPSRGVADGVWRLRRCGGCVGRGSRRKA